MNGKFKDEAIEKIPLLNHPMIQQGKKTYNYKISTESSGLHVKSYFIINTNKNILLKMYDFLVGISIQKPRGV